jgi:DsbC/DsbD-like thiol-disulfide interchange protein
MLRTKLTAALFVSSLFVSAIATASLFPGIAHAEAPITLSLTAPSGITLPKAKLVRADLAASTKESARFDVAFEAAEVGAKVIAAEARFVICQETACKPVKETLTLNIDVAAPAPAPKAKARTKAKAKA